MNPPESPAKLSNLPAGGFAAEFRPRTGAPEEWDAAYERVEDYLRAHRIQSRLHQARLVHRILERAAQRHELSPGRSPTALAAQEAEALMDQWFGRMLGRAGEPRERIAIDGRLALLLCDGAQRWPHAFLDDEQASPELEAAMQACAIQAGPDMAVSSMVPRPIDLGLIPEVAGGTIERIERRPMLQTLLLWLLFAAALAAIFYATR